MRIINRLGQTVLIDEYQPSRFEWQVLDSEGEPLNVGDSPSAQIAEECAVQAIIERGTTLLTAEQTTAIKCAYADLLGATQAHEQGSSHTHDWKAHALTVAELCAAFPTLLTED